MEHLAEASKVSPCVSVPSDNELALLAFQTGLGLNCGIEAAYTDKQKENRANLRAFVEALLALMNTQPSSHTAEPNKP